VKIAYFMVTALRSNQQNRDFRRALEAIDDAFEGAAAGGLATSFPAIVGRVKAKWDKKPAKEKDLVANLPGARKAGLPDFIRPQLATLVDEVPTGDEWLHEIKFDGYRALCRVRAGRVKFFTREGKDWTHRFGKLGGAAAHLPVDQAMLDGEIVVVEKDGATNFQSLQEALSKNETERLTYFVFDLLHLDGYDLTQAALRARKNVLAKVLKKIAGPIRFSDHIIGQGAALYRRACQLGLEGVISKQKESPYRPGRGREWVKTKCHASQEFVIGGFTDPAGSRVGLGALLLGVHNDRGELVYAGRVGTGFTQSSLRQLRSRLDRIATESPPFSNPPRAGAREKLHWIRPELVAEVEFTGWTRDGLLRHPSFKGLREDKPAAKITRERPAPASSGSAKSNNGNIHEAVMKVAGVTLTHPDRVLYPDQGITKRELAFFYEEIAGWILPHLADRPLTLVRCPEGYQKDCFYQKHVGENLPDWVRRVDIKEKGSVGQYVVVDSLPGLIALVQMGVLEIHTWGSRSDRVEQPDRLTFDLDPDAELPWKRMIEAARSLRRIVGGLGLNGFVKTTGGKGLHVVVPIVRKYEWNDIKEFSKRVAEQMTREAPDRYLATMSKAKRKGKIFIDYLRNGWGATAVAAYSTRARAGAPVSTPLTWEEVAEGIRPDQFNVRNLSRRLARLKKDPWENYESARRPITAAMMKEVTRGEK
jgi:bifunctional non-homologous end joining protein LigD